MKPIEQIYRKGFDPSHFKHLVPGIALLEPVLPPEKFGTIHTTARIDKQPGTMHLMYRVIGMVPCNAADNPCGVRVGDVIVCRNAFLESIHPNGEALVIGLKHVHGLVADDVVHSFYARDDDEETAPGLVPSQVGLSDELSVVSGP